jgi:hypothetical protein
MRTISLSGRAAAHHLPVTIISLALEHKGLTTAPISAAAAAAAAVVVVVLAAISGDHCIDGGGISIEVVIKQSIARWAKRPLNHRGHQYTVAPTVNNNLRTTVCIAFHNNAQSATRLVSQPACAPARQAGSQPATVLLSRHTCAGQLPPAGASHVRAYALYYTSQMMGQTDVPRQDGFTSTTRSRRQTTLQT